MEIAEKVILKTDVLADMSGKVTERSVAQTFPNFKQEDYQGKHVVIKGCAGTWAVMMLQHKLEGVAAHLSFALYDGKEIQIF
ncbi:MAG TPA: hypothetical protein VIJ93_11420 [bacterium]